MDFPEEKPELKAGAVSEQFNLIAREYDAGRRKFIPCFDDFYGGATAFLARSARAPARIVDLGAGTGILSAYWLSEFPDAKFVLVDGADEMLAVARRRFAGRDNVSFIHADYSASLPDGGFDVAISALSIHHLEDDGKRSLFARLFDALPAGGLFANYDQFCADTPALSHVIDAYWENQIAASGLSDGELARWRGRRSLDRECSVATELGMLRSCGFLAERVYSSGKFAVIMAVKPE